MATRNVQGVELETTEITVRMSSVALGLLLEQGVDCGHVWLTRQPDGTFALGIVTTSAPGELGLQSRAVEVDDRPARFPAPRLEG